MGSAVGYNFIVGVGDDVGIKVGVAVSVIVGFIPEVGVTLTMIPNTLPFELRSYNHEIKNPDRNIATDPSKIVKLRI